MVVQFIVHCCVTLKNAAYIGIYSPLSTTEAAQDIMQNILSLIVTHADELKLTIGCVCVFTDSSRVKRMCVAERRQPYSGADWCSGGESDEDDKGFFSECVNVCIQACVAVPLLINLTYDSSLVELHCP